MAKEPYSVLVRNACKKYRHSTEYVLSGLNMTIRAGSTYGLLGPSGCGKSTLLKCILGKLDIDCGIIQLSASKWKQVGYMPQAVSLHQELTLEELFKYYGTIYGINGFALSKRVQELTDLFELPPLDRQISVCSGGQKQRISLAVTLLHNPEILLLDEPTVGLDPLLSDKIMKYLISLSVNEGKTILITTHYMEEARALHTVGLMRGGVLLAEAPPENLIRKYNCDSLDEVFVHVINANLVEERDGRRRSSHGPIKSTRRLKSDQYFSWKHLQAVLYKNYKWSIRSLAVTLFVLTLPMVNLCVYLYGFANEETSNGIGYYNDELRHRNCSFKDAVLVDECPPSIFYSCQFIDIVRQNLILRDFSSLDEGMNALKQGETYGMLYIPRNFSLSLSSMMAFRPFDLDEIYENQRAHIWFDTTTYFNAVRAKIKLYDSLKQLIELKCEECGINYRLSHSIQVQPNVFGGDGFSHLSGWIPGLICGLLFYTTYAYSSSLISLDKSSGVLERDQMNGLTNAEILCGALINQFLVMTIQTLTSMVTAFYIFGEPCLGSYVLQFTLLMLCQLLGSLVGVFVGLVLAQGYPIMFLGIGIHFTNVLLNGVIWPTQGVHWILKIVSAYLPVIMITESYTNISLRGYDITSPRVYPGFINVISSIIIVVCLIHLKIRLSNNQL